MFGEILAMNKIDYKKYQNFLFNFSSSYSGGGLKRLLAFVKWFNERGGANFIVHENLNGKLDDFPLNTYHYINVSNIKKIFNYQKYIDVASEKMEMCEFYYSYNIPNMNKYAKKSWFHLSNVLPFTNMSRFNIPFRRKVELWWLGILTKNCLKTFDYVSAESEFSIDSLNLDSKKKFQISPNGSDVEIKIITSLVKQKVKKNFAVIIGTYHHKNLIDSYKIFKHLRNHNKGLKLIIFGDKETVPNHIKQDKNVESYGVIEHKKVLEFLANCKFYINTSMVENSWNAASEGIFLAKESYISTIPPHYELLKDSKLELVNKLDTCDPIIHIFRDDLKIKKLLTWDEIISNMIRYTKRNHER